MTDFLDDATPPSSEGQVFLKLSRKEGDKLMLLTDTGAHSHGQWSRESQQAVFLLIIIARGTEMNSKQSQSSVQRPNPPLF